MAEQRFTERELSEVLRNTGGNFTYAARQLSARLGEVVTRTQVANLVAKSQPLQEVVAELREELVDEAENNVVSNVRAGRYEPSVMVLRTLGRNRGYVTKVETESASERQLLEQMQEGRRRAAERGNISPLAAPADPALQDAIEEAGGIAAE